jgi:hypothetical protein
MNKHKFQITKGETFDFVLETGRDLTGYSGVMPVYDRKLAKLADVALTFRPDQSIDGRAQTTTWPVGVYDYYLRVTSPAGVIEDLLQGDICVE